MVWNIASVFDLRCSAQVKVPVGLRCNTFLLYVIAPEHLEDFGGLSSLYGWRKGISHRQAKSQGDCILLSEVSGTGVGLAITALTEAASSRELLQCIL
jgi:hypothetical protein